MNEAFDRARAQALRGLACLLVVVYHTVGSDSAHGLRVADGFWRGLCDMLSVVRMPLFALIAGAVWAARPRTGAAALADKAQRLLVPMLTVGTLFAIAQSLVPGSRHEVADWRLLHIVPVAHYWFLESIFLDIALVIALQACGLLHTPLRMAAVFLAACAVYLSKPAFIWFGVAGAAYLLPFFLGGVALVRWELGSTRSAWLRPAALSAVAAVALALASGAIATSDRFTAHMLASGLALATGAWLFAPAPAWLQAIGRYSFGIFLFHPFFTAAARMALGSGAYFDFAVHLVVGVLAGVAGPVMLQQAAGRVPAAPALFFGMPRRSSA